MINRSSKPQTIRDLLVQRRIILVLGAGGVGKTTSSIALAFAAAQAGKRVALLSIDPAKRLAEALGLSLGHELRPVAWQTSDAQAHAQGSVHAAMLDQKAVFDAMVKRHAPSSALAQKILAHPVYRAASTNLSGPLEYMAMAKLQELAEDERYDLVVLDTPPDTHALDFIERPNVLAGFMENKVMSWLVKPFVLAGKLGLGRVFSAGEKLMGGVAKVTGVKALHAFGEFLLLMQDVIEGFQKTGERVIDLLQRPDTGFFLVTAPSFAATRAAANLSTELLRLGYACDVILFNRSLPRLLRQELSKLWGDAIQANEANKNPQQKSMQRNGIEALLARQRGEEQVVERLKAALQEQQAFARQRIPAMLYISDQQRDLASREALLALADEIAAGVL